MEWKPARVLGTALLVFAFAACGGEAGAEGDAQAGAAAGGSAEQAGFVEVAGTGYSFRVVRCDLSGNSPDNLLLRGAGTAPDGRTLTVLVERRTGSELVSEGISVYFGSIVEGDHWTATGTRLADGSWTRGEMMHEPADGPLLQISGDEMVAEGVFLHETDDRSEAGVLRVVCTG